MAAFNRDDDWDRRSRRRFRIQQDVQYERLRGLRVLDAGTGKTLDMSSTALRFTTAIPLRPGDKVKVAMNWPVLLDATCHLKMVIHGWVLRSDTGTATVTIGHYELRNARCRSVLLSLPQQRTRQRRTGLNSPGKARR